MIYQNDKIKGVDLHGIRNILSQFADDTAAFLKYERLILDEFTKELERVEALMGLKVSYDKTTIYRIGSLRNTAAQLFTQKNFAWSDGPIETLGVKLNTDGSACEENFTEIMVKLHEVCNNWANRQQTLFGKVLVINTLIGSLFVYKFMTMLNLSESQIKEAENVIKNFLWSGKRPKIAYNTLCKDKLQGGTRLVNLTAKQEALKISWIFRLEDDSTLTECAYNNLDPILRSLIWRCNISKKDCNIYYADSFWKEMLLAWTKLNYHEPENKETVLDQIIWNNSWIKSGKKWLNWKTWINKNIYLLLVISGTKQITLLIHMKHFK